MKKTYWSFLIVNILLLSIGTLSCRPSHKIENQLLDSLNLSLAASKSLLDLDMTVIEQRKDELEQQRNEILRLHTDTFDIDLAQNMGKQHSLLKIYKRSIGDHPKYLKEVELLEKQIKNLRSDLKHGHMDKERFKQFYKEERKAVEALEWNAQAFRRDLYQMEPVYQRLAPDLDMLLKSLKANDMP